jgi:hypothetical protein
MNKNINLIAIACLLFLLLVPAVNAQDSGSEPTVAEQIDQIEEDTELLRGLEPETEIPVLFPSRDELREFINREMEETYTQEYIDELMAFYVAFGFLSPDFDIRASVLELLSTQVIGYYDTETQTMNLITDDGQAPEGIISLLDRITYSHEYVHALQDQHFDLSAYEEQLENSTNYDNNLAYQSLIEGDATFIMNEYALLVIQSTPPAELMEMGLDSLTNADTAIPPNTPDIFLQELFFPYFSGEQFVRVIFDDGGWEALNKLYEFPPQSTEQIIHPEKYLDGDAPIIVELPVNAPEGYESALSGNLGEFYIREWLGTQIDDEMMTNRAAAGWGGDAFNIYDNAAGEFALEVRIAWDNEDETEEFAQTFDEFMQSRLPDGTGSMGDATCYTGEVTICLAKVDTTVIDIVIAPTREVADALLN